MEKLSGGEWTVCLCLRLQWENKGIFILFNVHENELVDAILTHWIVIFVWNIVMLLNQNNVCFLMSVRLMESCFFGLFFCIEPRMTELELQDAESAEVNGSADREKPGYIWSGV